MPRILEESGFEVTDVTAVCHVARPGEPLWDWPRPFFHNFLPTLLAGGYLSVTETDAFWQDWYERAADPSAFLFLPPLIDIVARRR